MVSGKHSIFTHFPKDRNCAIYLGTKITRASCRRRNGTVVPRAEHSGDFIMRITKSSVKDVNLDIIIGALWWYKTWRNTVVTILPVQNKNFSGDPEEPNEVPGADEEAKSHLRGRNLERRHLGRRH